MVLNKAGKDYIAKNIGIGDCFVYSGLTWTAVSVTGDRVARDGGTAKAVKDIIDPTTDHIELRGRNFTKSDLKTANGGVDVVIGDVTGIIMPADGHPAGEVKYCIEVAPTPPDAAKFGLKEIVDNHLPEWISGYACAGCGARYPYICPEGYKRTECRSQPNGTHGCCPNCMVAFVKCEQEGVAPPTKGYLTVTTRPTGATVIVDGVSCGTTPVIKCELAPGHTKPVTITKSGYETVTKYINITAGQEYNLGTIILTPIEVPSEIPEEIKRYLAEVYCGGSISVGGCNNCMVDCTLGILTTPLPAGYTSDDICRGEVHDWCLLNIGWTPEPTADKGFLKVKSTPTGALVKVNGVSCGTTPVHIHECELSTGAKTVVITKSGYHTVTKYVTIRVGEIEDLGTITLTPTVAPEVPFKIVEIVEEEVPSEKAYVHILQAVDAAGVELSRASVYVDGVDLHHWTPEDLTFCVGCKCDTYVDCGPGVHTISVRKTGYIDWSKTVTIELGKEYTYTPVLTLGEEPTGEGVITDIDIPSKMVINKTYTGAVIVSVSTSGKFRGRIDFCRQPSGWDGTLESLPVATTSIFTEEKTLNEGSGKRLNWTWKVSNITAGWYVIVAELEYEE